MHYSHGTSPGDTSGACLLFGMAEASLSAFQGLRSVTVAPPCVIIHSTRIAHRVFAKSIGLPKERHRSPNCQNLNHHLGHTSKEAWKHRQSRQKSAHIVRSFANRLLLTIYRSTVRLIRSSSLFLKGLEASLSVFSTFVPVGSVWLTLLFRTSVIQRLPGSIEDGMTQP